MIFNHLAIPAYSGMLKFDMKIFVNVARLEIGHLFTQGMRGGGHPCILDTFLVSELKPETYVHFCLALVWCTAKHNIRSYSF